MRLPRLSTRGWLLAVYSLVWALGAIAMLINGGQVSTEYLGAYGLGVTAILFAFRDAGKPPPSNPPEGS